MRSHSTDNIAERVTFMVTSVAKRHNIKESWTVTESLVDGGLTSVAMVELMLEVERAFDLTLPDSELNVANFFSIVTLAVLLDRLTEPQRASEPYPPANEKRNKTAGQQPAA